MERVTTATGQRDPELRGRRWDSAAVPAETRFDAWQHTLGTTHMPFALDLTDVPVDAFSAAVHEQHLGEITLVDVHAAPHRGRHSRTRLDTSEPELVGLQYVVAGRERIRVGDERMLLAPGDLMLWDSSQDAFYEVVEPLHKRTLVLPRPVAAHLLPGFRGRYVAHVRRAGSAPTTLVRLLGLLSTELPGMDDGARSASATLLLQLMRTLDPARDRPARSRRRHWELRDQALQYIEEHLGDPGLCPATIAAALAVSVRTLYAAVEDLGAPLAEHIRHRRLARCHDELTQTTDAIGDIAFRWGFRSQSHFSRIFRDRYGMPPSKVGRPAGR